MPLGRMHKLRMKTSINERNGMKVFWIKSGFVVKNTKPVLQGITVNIEFFRCF